MITGGYLPGIMGKMAHKKMRMFQKYGKHLIFETYSPFCVQGNIFVYKRASKYTKTVQGGLCMDMKQIFHSIPVLCLTMMVSYVQTHQHVTPYLVATNCFDLLTNMCSLLTYI